MVSDGAFICESRISTPGWPQMCRENAVPAHSCAYVGLCEFWDADEMRSAEAGWVSRRDITDSGTFYGLCYYGVITREDGLQWRSVHDSIEVPLDIPVKYQLEFLRNSGRLIGTRELVTKDGLKSELIMDTVCAGWQGMIFRRAEWTGEIRGRETQMPGTHDNPCLFIDCRYHDGTSWYSLNRIGDPSTRTFVDNGNGNEWKLETYMMGDDDFRIFDVDPW